MPTQGIIGSRVGVFRTRIWPAVLLMPILLALATAAVRFLTRHRLDTSNIEVGLADGILPVYVAVCGLVMGCLWLATFWFWKVTLFEGGIRGATSSLGLRTLTWGEIVSVERIPVHYVFHASVRLQPSRGPAIVITEPLVGGQEFKEHVRRLAGEDHPFARLLHER